MLSNPPGTAKPDLSLYTNERHLLIIKYKTCYYSFSLPVRLAMYAAGINDNQTHLNTESILVKIGTYFQIQDDYLDVFGDPAKLALTFKTANAVGQL